MAQQSSSGIQEDRPLSLDEYKRYGRQMIMPNWGLSGQLKVKAARIAVVGAGGLGCPLLQYLAGAGVGTIGVIDHDTVDISNLHRQVLHTTERVGVNKAVSAARAMTSLNPHVKVVTHQEAISPLNASSILGGYDMVVDCTDRPYTRYLLSDASVLLDKTLVSGAAVAGAGQWAVYGGTNPSGNKRACYRCMWPRIVGEGGGKCDEVGVWGPVVGMVGIAMAQEILRVIVGLPEEQQTLHLFHMGGSPLVRSVKMRPPSVKCISCGPHKTIKRLEDYDYEAFCSGAVVPERAEGVERISAQEFAEYIPKVTEVGGSSRLLIDTRPPNEFEICALPGSTNIPLIDILASPERLPTASEVVFVCRRGNDSLIAASRLRKSLDERSVNGVEIKDVVGGLVAWSKDVDPAFPIY